MVNSSAQAWVSPAQREILESFVRRSTSQQRLVCRSRIVLGCSHGIGNRTLARELSVDRDTVRIWRRRWIEGEEKLREAEANGSKSVLEGVISKILDDAARSGAPSRFTAEQFCSLMAIACEDPRDSERPITHWTPREIADEAMHRNIVASISVRHVGRFLKRSRPQTPLH